MEPTWRCAWLVVEAGVVAPMLAFQGVAALPVVVAHFVVNGVRLDDPSAARCGSQSQDSVLKALMLV